MPVGRANRNLVRKVGWGGRTSLRRIHTNRIHMHMHAHEVDGPTGGAGEPPVTNARGQEGLEGRRADRQE